MGKKESRPADDTPADDQVESSLGQATEPADDQVDDQATATTTPEAADPPAEGSTDPAPPETAAADPQPARPRRRRPKTESERIAFVVDLANQYLKTQKFVPVNILDWIWLVEYLRGHARSAQDKFFAQYIGGNMSKQRAFAAKAPRTRLYIRSKSFHAAASAAARLYQAEQPK